MRVKKHLKTSVLEQDAGILEALSGALWLQPASDLHVEGKKIPYKGLQCHYNGVLFPQIICCHDQVNPV